MERPAEAREQATRANDRTRSTRAGRLNAAAFRAFYDRHVGAVLHFLRYQVRDDDRPDVTSRTFTFAAKHFESFEPRPDQEPERAERNWILTIARNAAKTWRQKKRQPDQTDFETVEAPDNPERDTGAFEIAAALLWTLPEHLRTIYLLHHREEMTHEELAEELDLPLGTVKSQLRAAQADLDAKIARLGAREGMKRGDYVRGAVLLPFGTRSIADAVRNVEEEVSAEAADHLWNEIATVPAQAALPAASPLLRRALTHGARSAAARAVSGITGAKIAALVAAFVVGGAVEYAALHLRGPEAPVPVAALDTAPASATAAPTSAPADRATAPSTPTARSGTAAPPAARSAAAADAFLTETDAIQAARAAFGSGNAAGALQNANKHAKQYPGGAFAPERESIAIRALVQLGRMAEARKRAETFRRVFPNSVFRGAVDAATGGSIP